MTSNRTMANLHRFLSLLAALFLCGGAGTTTFAAAAGAKLEITRHDHFAVVQNSAPAVAASELEEETRERDDVLANETADLPTRCTPKTPILRHTNYIAPIAPSRSSHATRAPPRA